MEKLTPETINQGVVNLNLELFKIIKEYENETGFAVDGIDLIHIEPKNKKRETANVSARVAIIY